MNTRKLEHRIRMIRVGIPREYLDLRDVRIDLFQLSGLYLDFRERVLQEFCMCVYMHTWVVVKIMVPF